MPTDLRSLLQTYRSKAISEREKGTYFEQLTKSSTSMDRKWKHADLNAKIEQI